MIAVVSIIILKLFHKRNIKKLKFELESTRGSYGILLKEYNELDQANSKLAEEVESQVELFEITKELTKYLTLNNVFSAFREKLKKFISLEDCRFIKSDTDAQELKEYELFPLKIKNEVMGYLAIKGLDKNEKNRFHILFNQFLLVLKRVQLYGRLEELSITDGLTGLFRRKYFQDRLEEEIERCRKHGFSFAFLMLDLDHFKTYNDRYGHLVGDVLLSTVANIIKENVRQVDIVGRYGGEEFTVMLPNTEREEAEYVSLRLRRAIEGKQIRAYDEDLQITTSIGVSFFPQDAKDLVNVIDKADRALYRAKQTGRNRVCFWSDKK